MSAPLLMLRQRITALDCQLITLLAKRKRLILQIGRYKLRHHLPLRDPNRERRLLRTLISTGQQQQLESDYIVRLFRVILQHSLATQQSL